MGLGSMMYAQDFSGHLSGKSWTAKELGNLNSPYSDRSGSDDDVNWLYPNYVKALGTFVCPSTRNSIRSTPWITAANAPNGMYLQDLTGNAVNTEINGTSYEVFGALGADPKDNSDWIVKKTEVSVMTREIKTYTPYIGTRPGPSAFFLIMDGDDTSSDPNAAPNNKFNNWPDPGNNHGSAGAAANFCDGHAEFIPLKRFLNVWNLGQDSNSVGH
jgi:hypothetical protein